MFDKIVLATQNLDKIIEITDILSDLSLQIISIKDFDNPWPDIDETGTTLKENAIIKARAVVKWTGLPALADDTGLEVEALNGQPGVFASRYAGLNVTYEQNRQKLLHEMKGINNRSCCFKTVVALVLPTGGQYCVEGILNGQITTQERGSMGFGYDPIFLVPKLNMTLAEISLEEKNKISHRGKAFRNAKNLLLDLAAK